MVEIPAWVFEFHGHKCPFMPIGYRMGLRALRELDMEKVKDHGAFAFSEMGKGHHNTCMEDGIQAATGCTTGKRLFTPLHYGKAAMILHAPGKGTVRVALRPEIFDELGKSEFLSYRKKGYAPSDIPEEVKDKVVAQVLGFTDDQLFTVQRLEDFQMPKVTKTFAKHRCESCGEYVFEPYLRMKDGKAVCAACAGHHELATTARLLLA